MSFVEGTCPKCNGVLSMPEDLDKVICMYCGEEIRKVDAIKKELSEQETAVFQQNSEIAFSEFPKILDFIKEPLKSFKKDSYKTTFSQYCETHSRLLTAIERAYLVAPSQDSFIDEVAKKLVSHSETIVYADSSKRKQDLILGDLNMVLAVYLIPAILEYKGMSSELLSKRISHFWKETYPKTNVSIATFQQINSGFHKKFCYITTAVCQSLHKEDECYELNLLRDYRDHYLEKQENGKELIKKYYNIAPTIVKHINKSPESHKCYKEIWETYLSECIHLIESNDLTKCQKVYEDMVNNLEVKYFM